MKQIVLTGFMATCPIAGVAWQCLHYILGLKKLGFEPIYIEDSARHPYAPKSFAVGEEAIPENVATMAALAKKYGFRWGYRARFVNPMPVYGDFSAQQISDLFKNAEATINICGAQELHDEYLKSKCRVYLETDPGVEQIKIDKKIEDTISYLKAHHFHFTFGENIGQGDCPLPTGGLKWYSTRQPVALDIWRRSQPRDVKNLRLTTVANWETKGKDIVWKNQIYYWSKTFEFLKFADLPKVFAGKNLIWEMATDMGRDPASKELFERQGWKTTLPHTLSCDFDAYIRYIQDSHVEWTVAKDQYVRLNTGWFSDRSASYLAAGCPVITQDTLFGKFIPVGEGLFAFKNVDDIRAAVEAIQSDYAKQSRKALEIAEEYFSAEKVVGEMMKRIGITA